MKRIHYPVPGKVCARYITRSVKRKARADKKLSEFLLYHYKGDQGLAKKAMSIIKGPGLGTLEMIVVADEFDEWWNGQWKVKKRRLVRLKGEKHRRAGKNSKKAVRAKAEKMSIREDAVIAEYIKNCIKGNG
jgi:hypothetical protein